MAVTRTIAKRQLSESAMDAVFDTFTGSPLSIAADRQGIWAWTASSLGWKAEDMCPRLPSLRAIETKYLFTSTGVCAADSKDSVLLCETKGRTCSRKYRIACFLCQASQPVFLFMLVIYFQV